MPACRESMDFSGMFNDASHVPESKIKFSRLLSCIWYFLTWGSLQINLSYLVELSALVITGGFFFYLTFPISICNTEFEERLPRVKAGSENRYVRHPSPSNVMNYQ